MRGNAILILGGYGGAGKPLSRYLLQFTDARVIIAGRSFDKAQLFVSELNRKYDGHRATAAQADASQSRSLANAIKSSQANLVLAAVSRRRHARQIADVCLAAKVDYFDVFFGAAPVEALKPLASRIQEAGRIFITQGGFHPGVLASLVKYAAPHFDRYDSARIGVLINTKLPYAEAVHDLLDEFADYKAVTFKDGKWQRAGYRDTIRMHFNERWPSMLCYAGDMPELHPLPQLLGLRELGMYFAGFNKLVDWFGVFIVAVLVKLKLHAPAGQLLCWAINTFYKPPDLSLLVLEAGGEKNGRPVRARVTLEHVDAYDFTAIPVVACLIQYMDEQIPPGLHLQAIAVEPQRFMADMQAMGVKVETTLS